jgi:hypothetical protein
VLDHGPAHEKGESKAEFGLASRCRRQRETLDGNHGQSARAFFVEVQKFSFIVRLDDFMYGLHRTSRDAGAAIDTHVGVNIAALAVGMETLDRTMLYAIGKKTKAAVVRYDMWHGLGTPHSEF